MCRSAFFPDICELSHLFIQSTDTFLGGCLKLRLGKIEEQIIEICKPSSQRAWSLTITRTYFGDQQNRASVLKKTKQKTIDLSVMTTGCVVVYALFLILSQPIESSRWQNFINDIWLYVLTTWHMTSNSAGTKKHKEKSLEKDFKHNQHRQILRCWSSRFSLGVSLCSASAGSRILCKLYLVVSTTNRTSPTCFYS